MKKIYLLLISLLLSLSLLFLCPARAYADTIVWDFYYDWAEKYELYCSSCIKNHPEFTDYIIFQHRSRGYTLWLMTKPDYVTTSGDYLEMHWSTAPGAWEAYYCASSSEGEDLGMTRYDGASNTTYEYYTLLGSAWEAYVNYATFDFKDSHGNTWRTANRAPFDTSGGTGDTGESGDNGGSGDDSGLLSSIIAAITSIGEKITSLPSSIANGFKGFFDSLFSTLADILVSIEGLVDTLLSGLSALLQELFVPSEGFLDENVSSLKDLFASRMGADSYTGLLGDLKNASEEALSFDGYIDITAWLKHLPEIKNMLRMFFYPLFIIGDIRFIIWLIRGNTPVTQAQ